MEKHNTENEVWKDIKGFEGAYQVSEKGRVRSVDRSTTGVNGVEYNYKGMILRQGHSRGYPVVTMTYNRKRYTRYVHRLVGTEFLPNPNNYPEINHISEVRNDNSVENL